MREAIFILLVLAVLLGLTAYRYRRQIGIVLELWRMTKSMRKMQQPGNERIDAKADANGKLVNCAKCGTWVPEGRAIRLGGNSVYCSTVCVEKSAKVS
jgi:hypothetical protein